MRLENVDQKTLRKKYTDFIALSGKSKSTASTTANYVFKLWNKRGAAFFWDVMKTDDSTLHDLLSDFLRFYYPNQMRYLPNYVSSIRYFKRFLASEEKTDSADRETIIPQKNSRTQQPFARVRETVQSVLPLTVDMLEEAHRKVLTDSVYSSDYTAIDSVLKRFPQNTDPELVVLKIALIDLTNSTHIGLQRRKVTLQELADIIVGIKDFDERLQQGDPSLVPLIAKTNGRVNLFSFASKYCTYHSVDIYGRDDYVIYDSVVQRALPKYSVGLHEAAIREWVNSYNFAAYKACIDKLLDANGIFIPFRRRKLDHFLWQTYRNVRAQVKSPLRAR